MKVHFDFEHHYDAILITPLLAVCAGWCRECECIQGQRLTIGWLFWQFHIVFSFPHSPTH